MAEYRHQICRVYPRLQMGGAENAIVQLLKFIPDTHMIVTHVDGMRAEEAKASADRYTLLGTTRFAPLVRFLSEAPITHIHTINDHLLIPLAAQLAGVSRIVQTVHNEFEPQYCHFVDHSILVGDMLTDQIATPGRSTVVPNGVPSPDELPEFTPWCAPGVTRPIVLMELRRPDKTMGATLEQIASTGALDGIDYQIIGVGFDTPSDNPRVNNVGPIADPYPLLASADLLCMGTAAETFGRTAYEAMAFGTLLITTPLPAFTEVFTQGELNYFSSHDLEKCAQELRALIDTLAADPAGYMARREANHQLIRDNYSTRIYADRTEEVYADIRARPPAYRNFVPQDLDGTDLDEFGAIVDDLFAPGPFTCLERMQHLPSRTRAIVIWLLIRRGLVPPEEHLGLLARIYQDLGPRCIVNLDLGRALESVGQLEQAVSVLRQASSLDPHNLDPQIAMINALDALGDRVGASKALTAARLLYPKHKVPSKLG
jgi:hypothetical protein